MANKEYNEKQKRLREIEDRKIAIILEIPSVKDNTEKMSALNHEYVQLDDEYYNLFIEVIKAKQRA